MSHYDRRDKQHGGATGVPTFYRIVRTDPPSLHDFLSAQQLGKRSPGNDPELQRLQDGLSVYATLAQARRKARASPALGSYVATLDIPDDAHVIYERTLTSSGHHTLWGDAALLCRIRGEGATHCVN